VPKQPTAPSAPSVPSVRLAPPPRPVGGGRPASHRRTVIGLALLVLAALAIPVANGWIGLTGIGSTTAVPERQASPRSAAAVRSHARAQPREARSAPDRVVVPTDAATLFAQHSWYVLPPAPPPAPPAPPAPPTAPPFPYTFVGSFTPEGGKPVFFLAQGDRIIDAHVGDKIDGVYQFESAAGGQLLFVYLPLDVRQSLAGGASQ
jgi:hypothetical protein